MRSLFLASTILLTTACATTPVPNMRPMSTDAVQKLSSPAVVVAESTNGVEATWFYRSTQGAAGGFGLIGVAVAAVMDVIINAAPAARAQSVATQLSQVTVLDSLDASLVSALNKANASGDRSGGLGFGAVKTVQKITSPDTVYGAIELLTTYQLAEDASAMRVITTASLEDPNLTYQTPYTFEGSVPKTQIGGPVYTNTFTYNSKALAVPTLDDNLKAELVKAVENLYRRDDGSLPSEGDEYNKMEKGIEEANDDELTKSETSIFLIDNWTRNNGSMLIGEIKNAHDFIAKYVLRDMNDTSVPSLDGQDQVLETLTDNRTVTRVGSGLEAGSYQSSPGNTTVFATYGNTVSVAKAYSKEASAIKKVVN